MEVFWLMGPFTVADVYGFPLDCLKKVSGIREIRTRTPFLVFVSARARLE